MAHTPDTRRQEIIVKYIAQRLVDEPDAVKLMRRVDGATVVLELTVAPDDVGRVIGKNGRVAESIRKLLAVVTPPDDRVILKII
jgi:uncharacterized protein